MHLLTFIARSTSTTIASSSEKSSGSPLFTIGLFAVMGLGMYFFLIRPQKRRQREAALLRASITVGDEVMTTSGVYGFVTGLEGDIAWLEIDDDVQIRVSKAAIQRKVDTVSGGDEQAESRRARPDSAEDDSATEA